MPDTVKPRKLKFIGCEIIYREACWLAATSAFQVDVEFLRKGLHDLETADMVSRVQTAIDEVDPTVGYEAIILGYARCNDGLVGVTARDIPLVIPRAHDCITFFFGSRPAYRTYFDAHPGTYYLTSGWSERNLEEGTDYARPAYGKQGVMGKLGLTETYEQMVEKYGKDNADFLAGMLGDWRKNYTRYLYLTMGVCDESRLVSSAREEAGRLGWEFELRQGNMSLLSRLINGPWDDDFLVVPPGKHIVARNDEAILGVE
jgi:hypothetical protein